MISGGYFCETVLLCQQLHYVVTRATDKREMLPHEGYGIQLARTYLPYIVRLYLII